MKIITLEKLEISRKYSYDENAPGALYGSVRFTTECGKVELDLSEAQIATLVDQAQKTLLLAISRTGDALLNANKVATTKLLPTAERVE